jgi:hypothetical protein
MLSAPQHWNNGNRRPENIVDAAANQNLSVFVPDPTPKSIYGPYFIYVILKVKKVP